MKFHCYVPGTQRKPCVGDGGVYVRPKSVYALKPVRRIERAD